jgi:hypothetical protein
MSGVEMLLGILVIQMFFVIFGNIKRNELLAEIDIHEVKNFTRIHNELKEINKVVSDTSYVYGETHEQVRLRHSSLESYLRMIEENTRPEGKTY